VATSALSTRYGARKNAHWVYCTQLPLNRHAQAVDRYRDSPMRFNNHVASQRPQRRVNVNPRAQAVVLVLPRGPVMGLCALHSAAAATWSACLQAIQLHICFPKGVCVITCAVLLLLLLLCDAGYVCQDLFAGHHPDVWLHLQPRLQWYCLLTLHMPTGKA
jgi:hypothetical protein